MRRCVRLSALPVEIPSVRCSCAELCRSGGSWVRACRPALRRLVAPRWSAEVEELGRLKAGLAACATVR